MDEPPVCARCQEEYGLEDGMDPSKYCHQCAHVRVAELEPMLKKLRDFIEFGGFYGKSATNIVIEADKVLGEEERN